MLDAWWHRSLLSSDLHRTKSVPSAVHGNFACDFDGARISLIGLMARRDNYHNLSWPFAQYKHRFHSACSQHLVVELEHMFWKVFSETYARVVVKSPLAVYVCIAGWSSPMEVDHKRHVCRILLKVDNLPHHLYRFWFLFCGVFYPPVAFLYVGLSAARSLSHRIWGSHSSTRKTITILVKVNRGAQAPDAVWLSWIQQCTS